MASNDEYQQQQFWEDKKVSVKWFNYDTHEAVEKMMRENENNYFKQIGFMRMPMCYEINIINESII